MEDENYNWGFIMSEAKALEEEEKYIRSIANESFEKGKVLGLVEGKNLGIEENQMKTIKNILNNNFDLKTISKITSKSIKDIKLIKESM